MSWITDIIFQFQERIQNRYLDKTLPLSIKKEDHANSFDELSDIVADNFQLKITDENKLIVFDTETLVTINWQTDFVPGYEADEITYFQLFGNYPKVTTWINNGDNTYSKLIDDTEARTKDVDQITLLAITINLGAFPQSGEIIIT